MKVDPRISAPVEVMATGCPRSGTLYLAHLLGWEHEKYYGIHRYGNQYELTTGPAVLPSVSWLAAPYLAKKKTAMVFHLVRNPFEVVRSNNAIGWLRPDDHWGKFAYSHVKTWDPWIFWLRWNEFCLSASKTMIRLEDISHLATPINTAAVYQVEIKESPTPEIPREYSKEIHKMITKLGY